MATGDVAHQRIRVMKAKEIVMGQQMEEVMMDTKDVKEILCAAVIIVKSSVSTFMRKMIAVRSLQATINQPEKKLTYQEHHLNRCLVNDAKVATLILAEDVARLRNLAMKEKGIVMVLEMEDSMMVIRVARDHLFVEPIIARNLERTIMKKTIVVRDLLLH